MCFYARMMLMLLTPSLFHVAMSGECPLRCENGDESFCCTCALHLYGTRCYEHCFRINSKNCLRRCYISELMFQSHSYYEHFDYSLCIECERYFNASTRACILCPATCLSCLDNTLCLFCKRGFYGNSCDQRCGNCKAVHSEQSECDIENGICIEGCLDGYYGHKCENMCGNCLPNEIGVVKCEKETGNCILGCADSYYGKKCDRKCSNCLPDKEGKIICDMNTGFCLKNCTEEYFGNACDVKCSINCLASKSSDLSVKCDKISGNCIYGCVPGWYGDTCNKPCSSPCYNKTCMQKSGHCSQGCVLGWYGGTCSKQCRSSCYNNSCIQKSGHCSVGCVPGWYGDTCNKPCSSFCSNRSCIQSSSYCKYGCVPGWYGVTCELHCPGTCKKIYCDRSTSECMNGCDAGFTGLFCNMTIKNGRNSSFDGLLGSLAGSIILIVFVFIFLAIRRVIIGKKNNASCEAKRTIYDEISDRNGLEHREEYLYIDTGNTYDTIRSLNDSDSNSLPSCRDKITETCVRSSGMELLTGNNTGCLCPRVPKTIVKQGTCDEPEIFVTNSSLITDKDKNNLNGSTELSSVRGTFSTGLSVDTYDSNYSDGYITPLYVQANDIENSENNMKEDAIEMVHVGESDVCYKKNL